MKVSNFQLLALAFIPGVAESNNAQAIGAGNMAWNGLFIGVINNRNASYLSLAISVISAIGALLITPATFGTGMVVGSLAVASVVSGVVCIASLYATFKAVMQIKSASQLNTNA